MEHSRALDKKTSRFFVWSIYVVVVFEMLYMSTPFALFFYSVYGMPLKFLSRHDSTLWLTQNILPHFTQTKSIVINTLLYMSWPLMGIGFLLFVIGFCQLYWVKFRRKGPVIGGLYRFIRHPQYAAWAILGLGMAIFWSRMIVWIIYMTMLFVYFLLAVSEEAECLKKYGERYRSYLRATGRFLPRIRKKMDFQNSVSGPRKKRISKPSLIVFYFIALLATIGLGFSLRAHTLSEISSIGSKDTAVVSLIPMGPDAISKIANIALNDKTAQEKLKNLPNHFDAKRLIYIMPVEWHVSELAAEDEPGRGHHHGFNPTNHGNPPVTLNTRYKVLISRANVNQEAEGIEILSKARGQKPLLIVEVDTEKKSVNEISEPPARGKYGDLPVPIF